MTKEFYHKAGGWTENQLLVVLNSNAQGATWTDISKDLAHKLRRDWRRADSATGVWQMGVGMTVMHPAYARAKDNAERKAKANAAKIPNI